MKEFYFTNGKVVLADKVLDGATVKVKDGKIEKIMPKVKPDTNAEEILAAL